MRASSLEFWHRVMALQWSWDAGFEPRVSTLWCRWDAGFELCVLALQLSWGRELQALHFDFAWMALISPHLEYRLCSLMTLMYISVLIQICTLISWKYLLNSLMKCRRVFTSRFYLKTYNWSSLIAWTWHFTSFLWKKATLPNLLMWNILKNDWRKL